MNSYTRKVASSSLLTIFGNFAIRSIGVVSTAVMARLLTPEDFGVIAIGAVIYGLFCAIGDLGARDYILRAEANDASLYNATYTFRFFCLVSSSVLLVWVATPAAEFYGDTRIVSILYVYALCLLISSFDNVYYFKLMRDLAYKEIVKTSLGAKLLNVSLNIILAFWLSDYRAIVFGVLGERVYHCVRTHALAQSRAHFSLKGINKNFNYAKWMYADVIIGYFRSKSDLFIAPRFLDPSQMGFYEMGRSHGGIIVDQLFQPVNSVLLSSISAVRDNDFNHLPVFCLQCSVLVALVFSPVVVSMWEFMDVFVILLLGDRWIESVEVFRYFLVFSYLTVFAVIVNEYFMSLNLLRQKMLASAVLTVFLVLGLVFVGIKVGDMESFAALRAYFAMFAVFVLGIVLRRYVSVPIYETALIVLFFYLLSSACLLISQVLVLMLQPTRLIEALASVTLSTFCYFVIATRVALLIEARKTSKLFLSSFVNDLCSRLPRSVRTIVMRAFVRSN